MPPLSLPAAAEPTAIDGDALANAQPTRLSRGQSSTPSACVRGQAPGQEVFEHAALMKYAFAGAILGQEQHATSDAMRHRAEWQRSAVEPHAAARARDEAGERARDEVGTGADLAGDAENFPRGARSDTSCTAPATASLSTIAPRPVGVGRGRDAPNGRPSISSISCSR